eukprot:gnl/MRDRNA2_/MRDRNA2_85595_c0_seq1.p1 gnl/MRDRNA2_/MRDRNA2_85595_c0~~gnl/MRDRNA2_/MRDRNA2_85595_c0_seq1.p1  ORF type:complete len:357 (+),score=40.32 gnl/MRDRNA2_/MRDRNA2_85595_c0_seq1:433-1503(+)
MPSISSQAIRKIREYEVTNLGKLAWASAFLGLCNARQELLKVVLAATYARLDEMSSPGAHAILWAAWRHPSLPSLWSIFSSWLDMGVQVDQANALDLLLMESEWQRDILETLLLIMLRQANPSESICSIVTKWAQGRQTSPTLGRTEMHRPVHVKMTLATMTHRGLNQRAWQQHGSESHWQKLGLLVDHVDCQMSDYNCSPLSLLQVVEQFASGPGNWLKVAGGQKAKVLESTLMQRRWTPGETAVEFGCFVGYSAIRFASSQAISTIISIEVNPIQACIARHFVDLAGVSLSVEVWIGQVRDVMPRLVEEFSVQSCGFLFFDHKGQIFHEDLALAERLVLLARGAYLFLNSVDYY